MNKLAREAVRYIFVHTAASDLRGVDAAMIRSWHMNPKVHPPNGWSDIGYHYVILDDTHPTQPDGMIQPGRSVTYQGAHVAGVNHMSIGICCVGHGDHRKFTNRQTRRLIQLCDAMLDFFPNTQVSRILGHRDVNQLVVDGIIAKKYMTSKTCPGTLIDMEEIREAVRDYRRSQGQ